MTKSSRWMNWVLEESAKTPNLLPNSRQARADRRAFAAKLVAEDAQAA